MPPPANAAKLSGLSEREAGLLRARGEGNLVQPSSGRTYLRILAESVFAPVNVVLFGVSVLLVALGLAIDAALTSLPVLLNVVAGVALEARAKRRLERLTIIARPRATVVRDGAERDVAPEELVRGDIVVAARGDQIVLDGVIEDDGDIEVDESLLTGESEPIVKRHGDELLSGTTCISGRTLYRVTHVGLESYANRLILRARVAKREQTPLQRDIARIVGLSALSVLLVSAVVGAGLWQNRGELGPVDAAQAAAVLVALVPQGLVIMVTLTYALGALRISRSGALIERINAVESMSRVDTLLLDKTGTLTSPRMEVRRIATFETDEAEVRGLLAELVGSPRASDRTASTIRAWVAAASADVGSALPKGARQQSPMERVAFASDRRWSGALLDGHAPGLYVLGAPEALETVLADGGCVSATAGSWTELGLRVLVFGRAAGTGFSHDHLGRATLPTHITPIAVLGLGEELRPDAAETLANLTAAGISVKVVSGDHRRTVAGVASRLGIDPEPSVDGPVIESFDDDSLMEAAGRYRIFGRVTPPLKARIVQALRRGGRYVAMVGDGVNDIVALKAANLGVAMESGSPAARATADVVLLRDSFAVLPRAVVEGQRIVEGMRLVTCLLLTRTMYMTLIILGAALLGLDFPMTPRTNAVLALVTVGVPTLVLALWARPVRSEPSLLPSALRFSVPAALAVAMIALPLYGAYVWGGVEVGISRSALTTMSVFCGVLLIPFLVSPRPQVAAVGTPGLSIDVRPTLLALGMVALYGAIAALPVAREFFDLDVLQTTDVLAIGALALAWAGVLFVLRKVLGPGHWRLGRREVAA